MYNTTLYIYNTCTYLLCAVGSLESKALSAFAELSSSKPLEEERKRMREGGGREGGGGRGGGEGGRGGGEGGGEGGRVGGVVRCTERGGVSRIHTALCLRS